MKEPTKSGYIGKNIWEAKLAVSRMKSSLSIVKIHLCQSTWDYSCPGLVNSAPLPPSAIVSLPQAQISYSVEHFSAVMSQPFNRCPCSFSCFSHLTFPLHLLSVSQIYSLYSTCSVPGRTTFLCVSFMLGTQLLLSSGLMHHLYVCTWVLHHCL